jgi:glycine/D-amino acid oxidase-like deaminating enzyme/nitrite reductase/ring-hydroxylating ferredoxin subunit
MDLQERNMPTDSGQTTPAWMTVPVPTFSPLQSNLHTDVCIVGAGIAGLTTAYLLAQEGKSVVVLDDGPIGGGETGRTTAHLSFALDDRYTHLERLHGRTGAQLAAESHAAAVDRIEAIVQTEGIDCDFERLDGYLFVPPGDSTQILQDELEAAHRAGLNDVVLVNRAPLSFFDTGLCLQFPRQGQFHPLKYLAGLAHCIEARGGQIFTATRAEQIQGGERAQITTATGATVTADAVVVATNTPVNDMIAIHTKQGPYRTYAIALRVPRGAIPRALYWDTPDPYHYVRLAEGPDETSELLIVGGEDHKTGQEDEPEKHFTCLEEWTYERFPMATDVVYRWSGQVMEPVDGLAYIGPNPMDEPNVYIATGDSGHGMTHGTIAGILLTDLILGRPNPWASLYDPSRKTAGSLGELARENLNVAAQYTDWVTGSEVDSVAEIAPGQGALLRQGLSKVAVYRDPAGALHSFTAVCPHMHCIVHWNRAEASWDCPCHGSRFDAYGRMVNGPANSDLEEVELTKG